MRIAFHAPLKPPDHPVPSGDRRMARSLLALLARLGHEPRLASPFRTHDRLGDQHRQQRLAALGARLATRLLRRAAPPPDLWLTYHCYHKAPDLLGPTVSRALDIPYLIVEPSRAAKQMRGPWAPGFAAADAAFAAADLLLAMTAVDADGLASLPGMAERTMRFPPFLDAAPFAAAARERQRHRALLAARLDLDPDQPWLLTVAMMRADIKQRSYLLLAETLARVTDRPWQLLVVGDGPAGALIRPRLLALGAGRVRLLGQMEAAALPGCYAAADLLVWPALREAYGLALLEAQAAGTAVLACREGGVGDVVLDGHTGRLVEAPTAEALAAALGLLLDRPDVLRHLGAAASARVAAEHDLPAAEARLAAALLLARQRHDLHRRTVARC